MSNKFAWTWKIKEECLEEYVRMHREPWPDMLAAHSAAGIKNYSIFQNGNQFFYCFECDDTAKAFAFVNESAICQKWNAITSQMVENSFDLGGDTSITQMKEIFYLA